MFGGTETIVSIWFIVVKINRDVGSNRWLFTRPGTSGTRGEPNKFLVHPLRRTCICHIIFTTLDAVITLRASRPSFVQSSRRSIDDRRRCRLRSMFGAFADLDCFRNRFEAHVGRRQLLLAFVDRLAKTKQGAGHRYVFHI
jgi:hypothetical protein